MNQLMKTYKLIILIIVSTMVIGCAAEQRDESKSAGSPNNEFLQEISSIEEKTTDEISINGNTLKKETNEIRIATKNKKLRKKARQKLETIQDLMLILQDSTLNSEFRVEIEGELNNLYPEKNILEIIRNNEPINFKQLNYSYSNDTLNVKFRNKKNLFSANFVTILVNKQFGEEVEQVEQLKLISIKKEN